MEDNFIIQNLENTVYVPISRPWCVKNVFKILSLIDINEEKTEVIIMVDCIDVATKIWKDVQEKSGELAENKGYGLIRVLLSGNNPLPDDAEIIARRQRIIELWEMARKEFHPTKIFFGFEDDSVVYPGAFQKLKHTMGFHHADYVEGIQVHRQFNSIGAWRINITDAHTLPFFDNKSAKQIDGGGFYCFVTKTKYILKAVFRENGACFGPDVCFVHDLAKMGRIALADFNVLVGHLMKNKKLLMPDETVQQLKFVRNGEDWERVLED